MSKTTCGNFFEDFHLGQEIRHAVPRTVTAGDVALYQALYGGRFALSSSLPFACSLGFVGQPVDDLLIFHVVFGKTVADLSLNAVANLGYAEGRFGVPVYPGDTLAATSQVIGLKETSNRLTGVVYVRSTGVNQQGEMVVDYVRWVMVRKRHHSSPAPGEAVPATAAGVPAETLVLPAGLDLAGYDRQAAGSLYGWEDYREGEVIDHVDGSTIDEAEHMMATRLYHNTARVHFNQHVERQGRFGRRLVYGGHIISLARALSFNGLANAFKLVAINGGRHVAPCFAGDTIYAWSRIEEKMVLPGRSDVGALRVRTIATKDQACGEYPYRGDEGKDYHSSVVLEFDYTVLMPRNN
jgi:2-methylfumaryl-CoA hydratase